MKNLKNAATVVGCLAGIVTGIDKIKTTLQKWRDEYNASQSLKKIQYREPDEDRDEGATP